MTKDEPQWIKALRAICAQKRDYFVEAIREMERERKVRPSGEDAKR